METGGLTAHFWNSRNTLFQNSLLIGDLSGSHHHEDRDADIIDDDIRRQG